MQFKNLIIISLNFLSFSNGSLTLSCIYFVFTSMRIIGIIVSINDNHHGVQCTISRINLIYQWYATNRTNDEKRWAYQGLDKLVTRISRE